MIYNEIGKLLKTNDNFAILTHVSPDGDALGCSLSLFIALTECGKTCDVIIDDSFPQQYNFLPFCNNIIKPSESNNQYDVALVLDCGNLERIGASVEIYNKCKIKINIDHHITNDKFANLNIVEPNASSTGEIIYQLLKINGYTISKQSATCLYTALLTDTGGFKYSNTTSATLSIAGDLINSGIDFGEINDKIFSSRSVSQVKLLSIVTSTLELYFDNKAAVLSMRKSMLEQCNANEQDSSELVNIARDINDVEIGIFIKEKQDKLCRVSMRSKKYVDVKDIALTFNGGGHIRAAGCTIEGSLEDVKLMILNEVKKQLYKQQ